MIELKENSMESVEIEKMLPHGYGIRLPLFQELRAKIVGTSFIVADMCISKSLLEISYEVMVKNDFTKEIDVVKMNEILYVSGNSDELSIGRFIRELDQDISPLHNDISELIGLEGTIFLEPIYHDGMLCVYVSKRQFDINDESYDGHNDDVPYMRLTRR